METSLKPLESFSSLVRRRFAKHRLALASLLLLLFLTLLSVCAPLIEKLLQVSHDQASLVGSHLGPKWPHLLGTNELGQDVFTRLIFGGRISLMVGFIAATTSALIGAFIGLLAGYFGGRIDSLLMRFTDAMLSIPVLPLMIVFAALDLERLFSVSLSFEMLGALLLLLASLIMLFRFIGDSPAKRRQKKYFLSMLLDSFYIVLFVFIAYLLIFKALPWKAVSAGNISSVVKLILIISFFGWMTVARLARASALQLKNMDFVLAARALGASHQRIILQHILPNALAPIIVAATLEVGENILYEAALSFLGLGIQPPVSSWGNMLNNAVDYIKSTPSLAFWPGLFILITVACFNFLGDGMRDALDPHQVMKNGTSK